jgi:hypothetical protein
MQLESKPSRMKISRMSLFGRVHRPNVWHQNTLQIILLYVTEANTCLLLRTIYIDKNIHVLQISILDLWVSDTKSPSLGLHLSLPGQSSPVFIRLPRSKSLGIMKNGKKICAAMRSCAQTQPESLSCWAKWCCYAWYLIIAWHGIGAQGAHI